MTKEEVPCGSKVSGFGGPEGGEGQPSRADLKGEQLAGQGHVARPTSLALSHSNCPLTTACEHGYGSSAGSCGAACAATASPPSSCLPVCSVLPQHNTAVLASPSQHATNLPQSGICTVALTPITPTVMQPVFVPTIPQLGVPVSHNSVSLPVPGTLLTPTSLSPSTPNSKSVNASVNGMLLQPPTVITVPSRTFLQCQNSHVSNNYQLTYQPTVHPVPNITVSSTSDSISLSLRAPDEKRDLNSLTASQPVVPITSHVLGQQSHLDFSARGANSIANNTVATQPRFIISNRIDNQVVLSDQESNSSTLIPNPLPISFSSNSVPGNAGHLVGNSLQVISVGNPVTTPSSIHYSDPNLFQFVQTTPSNGTPRVEQCAVRSESSHLRSNSLPLFDPCSSESAGLHTSTLPKSPSLPVSGANSDSLPGTSRTGSTFRPIRIQRKTGFFFQGQLPLSPNPTTPSDQSAEKSYSTRRFDVDLWLTLPPSPSPVESDDVESFYSFQGDETASVKTSDDSSDDCEPAIRPGIQPAARRDTEGASESLALMLLDHIVMSAREDYDPYTMRMREDYYPSARSSRDNYNPSVVLEQRPVFDEFEPVSDHDQNEPVAQYSDSDIDASFAVAAYATMSSEIDEFADQSAIDSDAADSDELDMTAFFIARHRREEKRRRSKRDNCDLSSGPSESDPDFNDDRWKCLECNQANNRSFFRYCEKCWKMRRCWLPDPPKKRKKKKPRHRPRKRRSTDKTSKAAGGVQTKAGASKADTAGCSSTTQVACSGADDVNAGGRGAAQDTCLEVRGPDTDVQRASGSVGHSSETLGTHLSGESCTRRSESFGTDAVEAKPVVSEANTAALRCSSDEGTSGVGGASSAAAERPCNLQILECVPDVEVSSACAPRCATEGESLATSAAGASNSKESSDHRSDNLSCEKIQSSEEKTQVTEEGARITAHAAQTCSFIACRKKIKDLVSCPHPEREVLESEDPSEDNVDGGAPALVRCSSTASTVILDPDETQFRSALQDCTRKLTDPVSDDPISDDPVPTKPVSVDPASAVPASDERKLLLGKILSNNLFSSVSNSMDTVGWHNEWPNSSPRSEKSDMGVHDGQQHHSTDPGTDLDHCSTASGADSIPSVVDSGLGSSQDLFQESSQDVPAHLPANASSYRSAIVFTSPKKKDAFSTERRRRSNSSNTRIEVIDFVIEEVGDDSPSKRSGDRGRKRKSAMLEAEARKKRKANAYGPIAAYLNEGLDLIDETTDVQKLPQSHAVRIIGETLVQFLRSPDGWEWLSSSKGRSWMSSPPVQAVLHESLRRSTESAEASSSVFGDNLCIMCQDRPKDAVIIHGKISHQATCYKCAKTICDRKQRCPVCRRKILRIAKNIII